MKKKMFLAIGIIVLILSILPLAGCFKLYCSTPTPAPAPAPPPADIPSVVVQKDNCHPVEENCCERYDEKCHEKCYPERCQKDKCWKDVVSDRDCDPCYWSPYEVKMGDDILKITRYYNYPDSWWVIIYHRNAGKLWDPDLLHAGEKLIIPKPECITQTEIQDAIVKSGQHKYASDHDYCRLSDGPEYGWLKEWGVCPPPKPDWVVTEIEPFCKCRRCP